MGLESEFESPDTMKEIKFMLSRWHKDQLQEYADSNGLTMAGLLRFMINQSIKTGFKFLIESKTNAKKDEIR
jgi:hypothetical protein